MLSSNLVDFDSERYASQACGCLAHPADGRASTHLPQFMRTGELSLCQYCVSARVCACGLCVRVFVHVSCVGACVRARAHAVICVLAQNKVYVCFTSCQSSLPAHTTADLLITGLPTSPAPRPGLTSARGCPATRDR